MFSVAPLRGADCLGDDSLVWVKKKPPPIWRGQVDLREVEAGGETMLG